jgi:hypothetical protein
MIRFTSDKQLFTLIRATEHHTCVAVLLNQFLKMKLQDVSDIKCEMVRRIVVIASLTSGFAALPDRAFRIYQL